MASSPDIDRITRLEERVAYQEQTISDLDDVVREFAERVEVLERQLAALRESIQSGSEIADAEDEPPPHY